MMLTRLLPTLAAITVLSACAAQRKPLPAPPPPAPAPAPIATAMPAEPPADWRDAAQTPGDWRYARLEQSAVRDIPFPQRTMATFSSSRTEDLFAVTCEVSTKQMWLGTSGTRVPEVDDVFVTITTTSMTRTLASPPRQGNWIDVSVSPRDLILDAMAFSRGRFMVEVPGMGALYLPAWPEIGRVIEDCR